MKKQEAIDLLLSLSQSDILSENIVNNLEIIANILRDELNGIDSWNRTQEEEEEITELFVSHSLDDPDVYEEHCKKCEKIFDKYSIKNNIDRFIDNEKEEEDE